MQAKSELNICNMCSEGYRIGSSIYCGIDGRFYPLKNDNYCIDFHPKKPFNLSQGNQINIRKIKEGKE